MNIPIRSQLRAKKDYLLLSFDEKQAEAWVVAYLANEPTMKLELQFGEIHIRTARAVLEIPAAPISEEKRYVGKKCNHAFNYKMKPARAAEVINKEGIVTVSVKQTTLYRKRYLELYRIEGWWLDIENQLRQTHRLITPYGFERRFYNSGDEGVKEGIAFIPQSTIADHTYGRTQPGQREGGLKLVHRSICNRDSRIRIVHTAHDSGILEFPKTIDVKELFGEVKECMERPMEINGEEFTIPVDGKYGERWEEFEKVS